MVSPDLLCTERRQRAAVRKRLERWGLALKVRDGIQAGVVAGNNVAYVAANVDAVPQKQPKAKPEPYRLLFVVTIERLGRGPRASVDVVDVY